MTELLAVVVGAAIALYAYHTGRNNAAPPLPKLHLPFFGPAAEPPPRDEPAKPTHSRGM